jgi:protein-S-isoprenylcysteine O-methyltransferase Ste14
MAQHVLFDRIVFAWLAIAVLVFVLLFFFSAPYGRYARRGWGPAVGNRVGWIIMEAAASISFALCFIYGEHNDSLTALLFLTIWEAHYVQRAFIYPFLLRNKPRSMPWVVILLGLCFNGVNGYLNGHYLFTISSEYTDGWITDPRFMAGAGLFVLGYFVNRRSDGVLRKLRGSGETGYRIPRGYLFRWISSPNYLGEIVLWIGWAMATWSLAGLAFAIWTVANLAPRARAHHRWYQEHFPDYPPDRRALLPALW